MQVELPRRAALIRAVRNLDVGTITLPALFLVSPADTIVDPAATEDVAARWGGPHTLVQVPVTGDPNNHVLAGRILSPATSAEIAGRISDWIAALPGIPAKP